jgi:DNA-binding transcriptional regulator YiaG
MSEELRNKLKAARAKLGLSQSQAATAWEVPLRTLIGWENNQRTPRGFALSSLNTMLDAILAEPAPKRKKP